MRTSRLLLLALVYLGFICLGLPSAIFGVAWPSVREAFHLDQRAAGAVFLGFGLSCFITSFFTAHLLRALGVGVVIAGGTLLVAASTAGCGLANSWPLFVFCSILHGFALVCVVAGFHSYLTHHTSGRHPNWLHGCYSFGAIFGPAAMPVIFLTGLEWRWAYFALGALLMVLSLAFGISCRWWDRPEENDSAIAAAPAEVPATTMRASFGSIIVWLQMLLLFICAGLEFTVGYWTFPILTESRGFARDTAAVWIAVFWACMCGGRLAFAFFAGRVCASSLVRGSVLTALAGLALLALNPPGPIPFPPIALILIGIGLSGVLPCTVANTAERLGQPFAASSIPLQYGVFALGGAVISSLGGYYGQRFGLELIPLIAAALAVILWLLNEGLVVWTRRTEKTAPPENENSPPAQEPPLKEGARSQRFSKNDPLGQRPLGRFNYPRES